MQVKFSGNCSWENKLIDNMKTCCKSRSLSYSGQSRWSKAMQFRFILPSLNDKLSVFQQKLRTGLSNSDRHFIHVGFLTEVVMEESVFCNNKNKLEHTPRLKRRKRCIPPKRRYNFNGLSGVISHYSCLAVRIKRLLYRS